MDAKYIIPDEAALQKEAQSCLAECPAEGKALLNGGIAQNWYLQAGWVVVEWVECVFGDNDWVVVWRPVGLVVVVVTGRLMIPVGLWWWYVCDVQWGGRLSGGRLGGGRLGDR